MVQRIPARSGASGRPLALGLVGGVLLLCLLAACSGLFVWSNGGLDSLALSDAPAFSPSPVSARVVGTPTEALPTPTLPPAPSPTTTRAPSVTPTAPPTATATRPPTATATPFKYKIKSGDSLLSIAAKYKISVQDLMQANGLTTDLIRIGDELIIPRSTPIPNR